MYKATWSESEYHYDPNVRAWRRYDVGQPLIDELTGQQLAPSNVLLLYANHANSDILADTHDPDHPLYAVLLQLWGQGSGKLFRDGRVYDIQWLRQDAQGIPILVLSPTEERANMTMKKTPVSWLNRSMAPGAAGQLPLGSRVRSRSVASIFI